MALTGSDRSSSPWWNITPCREVDSTVSRGTGQQNRKTQQRTGAEHGHGSGAQRVRGACITYKGHGHTNRQCAYLEKLLHMHHSQRWHSGSSARCTGQRRCCCQGLSRTSFAIWSAIRTLTNEGKTWAEQHGHTVTRTSDSCASCRARVRREAAQCRASASRLSQVPPPHPTVSGSQPLAHSSTTTGNSSTASSLLLQLPSSPGQRWRSTHRRISLRCTLTTTYSVRGQHRVPHYPRRDRPAGASSSISH
jgi:hypothetical protein